MQAHNVKPWNLGETSPWKTEVNRRFRERVEHRDSRDRAIYNQRALALEAELLRCAEYRDFRVDVTAIDTARALVLYADWLQALAETYCDGVPREIETSIGIHPRRAAHAGQTEKTFLGEDCDAQEASEALLRAHISSVVAPFGVRHIKISGDPRGACLRLFLPTGAQNGAGDGWAV